MDKVTVTRAAQSLLQCRLLKSEPYASDRHSHRLALTSAGERLYKQIAPWLSSTRRGYSADPDPADADRLKTQLLHERAAEALHQL